MLYARLGNDMNKRNIAIGSIAAILGLAAIGNALPDEAPAR